MIRQNTPHAVLYLVLGFLELRIDTLFLFVSVCIVLHCFTWIYYYYCDGLHGFRQIISAQIKAY